MSPMMGRRRSIHFKAGLVGWKSDGPLIDAILRRYATRAGRFRTRSEALADLDFGIGEECVGRHREIGRRRPLADAAGGIVLRAMAGAEETVVAALMRDRDATEMGADANHDQPLLVAWLGALLVGLRIGEILERHLLCFLDLLLGAVHDVDRLAAPENLDVL